MYIIHDIKLNILSRYSRNVVLCVCGWLGVGCGYWVDKFSSRSPSNDLANRVTRLDHVEGEK